MQKSFVIAGSALIFLALALPVFVSMATIVYGDFKFIWVPPHNAFDPATPYPLEAGRAYILNVEILDTTGIPSVSVVVHTVNGNTSLSIPYLESNGDRHVFWLEGQKLPSSGLVSWDWTATSAVGGKTISATTYGKVVTLEGYYSINGQQVEIDSEIFVEDATVTFGFTATSWGEGISKVKVLITDSTGTLIAALELAEATTDAYWEGSYTLPKYGTYKVEGYIHTNLGIFKKMSLLMPWGESTDYDVIDGDGTDLGLPFNPVSMALGIMGLAFLAVGLLVPSKKKRK